MTKVDVQVSLDRGLVERANSIFGENGLTTTAAIAAFYEYVGTTGAIPVDYKTDMTASGRLDDVIQLKIDQRQFEVIDSQEKLDKWLKDTDED